MKKGFTLIEVLGVLIVLAIISLITVPMVMDYIDVSKEKAYEQSIKGIIDAAKYYVSSEDITSDHLQIQVKELKEKGYLDKVITDPRNGNNMEEGYVVIDWINNKYQYSFGYVGESDSGKNDSILAINKLTIDGKSEQKQTTQGKNLFDQSKLQGKQVSRNGDIITFTRVDQERTLEPVSIDLDPGTYVISYELLENTTKDSNHGHLELRGPNSYRTYSSFARASMTPGKIQTQFTITDKVTQLIFYFGEDLDVIGTKISFRNLQIEKGTQTTSYVPFTPNSPSPDYPSEIRSVGDSGNTTIQVTGKNLVEQQSLIIAMKNKEDGKIENNISIDGYQNVSKVTRTTNTGWFYSFNQSFDKSKIIKGHTYTVSIMAKAKTKSKYLLGFMNGNSLSSMEDKIIEIGTNWERYSITFQATDFDKQGIYLGSKNTNEEVYFMNLQIEEGDVATDFELYQSKSYSFPVTLRSLPDGTHDELVIDNISEKAYVKRNVGIALLDGREGVYWENRATFTNTYELVAWEVLQNAYITSSNNINLYSNYFKIDSQDFGDFEYLRGSADAYQNTIVFHLKKSRLSDNTGITLINWLKKNSIKVFYRLKEEQEEVLTYEPITPLTGSTHIYIEGTTSPNIHLDYIGS